MRENLDYSTINWIINTNKDRIVNFDDTTLKFECCDFIESCSEEIKSLIESPLDLDMSDRKILENLYVLSNTPSIGDKLQ